MITIRVDEVKILKDASSFKVTLNILETKFQVLCVYKIVMYIYIRVCTYFTKLLFIKIFLKENYYSCSINDIGYLFLRNC